MLFDRGYWAGLLDWLRGTLLDRGAISAPDLDLFTVTDDVAEAVEAVKRGNGAPDLAERPE